jgi:hypothetical protein
LGILVHGGGGEDELNPFRALRREEDGPQQLLDVRPEALHEHGVHFVDDHVRHFGEVEVAHFAVLEEPPGRRHHQVHAAGERARLLPVVVAAHHHGRAELGEVRNTFRDQEHLLRELARGHEHEHLGALHRPVLLPSARQVLGGLERLDRRQQVR